MADLLFAESQRREAGAEMRLIAPLVVGLLARRPVISPAVALDDKSNAGPVEVDAVSVSGTWVLGRGSPISFASLRKRRSSPESVRL